ncbi:MAG: hypothetical protein KatS3mg076_2940 [Candidatus Binatia bacterium]|nr:MAG: hypothetical protein KatS3mg076_2940 [Candidatus Binatia bacterium]
MVAFAPGNVRRRRDGKRPYAASVSRGGIGGPRSVVAVVIDAATADPWMRTVASIPPPSGTRRSASLRVAAFAPGNVRRRRDGKRPYAASVSRGGIGGPRSVVAVVIDAATADPWMRTVASIPPPPGTRRSASLRPGSPMPRTSIFGRNRRTQYGRLVCPSALGTRRSASLRVAARHCKRDGTAASRARSEGHALSWPWSSTPQPPIPGCEPSRRFPRPPGRDGARPSAWDAFAPGNVRRRRDGKRPYAASVSRGGIGGPRSVVAVVIDAATADPWMPSRRFPRPPRTRRSASLRSRAGGSGPVTPKAARSRRRRTPRCRASRRGRGFSSPRGAPGRRRP